MPLKINTLPNKTLKWFLSADFPSYLINIEGIIMPKCIVGHHILLLAFLAEADGVSYQGLSCGDACVSLITC